MVFEYSTLRIVSLFRYWDFQVFFFFPKEIFEGVSRFKIEIFAWRKVKLSFHNLLLCSNYITLFNSQQFAELVAKILNPSVQNLIYFNDFCIQCTTLYFKLIFWVAHISIS